ncbi:D-aspartate oxidase [Savitreella phatthalungensis]
MPTDIVVLGAGVLGLTIAYQLSRADQKHKYRVRIVAKSFPDDPDVTYTSQYAGANWRSVCANDDQTMQGLERDTLLYLRNFARSPDGEGLVRECMAIDYFDPRQPDEQDARIIRKTDVAGGEQPWFKEICSKYAVLRDENLPPGVQFAVTFDTVTINAPQYVQWLYERCIEAGVEIERKQVSSLEEAALEDGILVNATGLAARELANDSAVYATRGQTVLVRNTTNLKDTLSRVGDKWLSYLIPRPGEGELDGLIIGGCQQPGNESYEVDEQLAQTMLGWAKELYPGVFPQDHEFEVLKHNVGMRPSRKGGVRIERESLKSGKTVVHAYGIGGWGYQSSWGIGLAVQRLL